MFLRPQSEFLEGFKKNVMALRRKLRRALLPPRARRRLNSHPAWLYELRLGLQPCGTAQWRATRPSMCFDSKIASRIANGRRDMLAAPRRSPLIVNPSGVSALNPQNTWSRDTN